MEDFAMVENKEFRFSRLFGRKKEEPVAEPVIDEASIPTTAQQLPQTVLTFTQEQEIQFTEDEKEELRSKLAQMPPLPIGEVNFIPFEVGYYMDGYYVKVFIRNGKDVMDEVSFEQIPLYLVDASGEKVAGGIFRPKNFGNLKFGETRVWTFAWRPEQILKQKPDFSSISLAFE
jgi:SLAP domain-containing protein